MHERKITIFCDGGLGNRLGSLVGGISVAQQLAINNIEICWPANNWCGCYFEDLFDNKNFKVNQLSINDVFVSGTDNVFLIHENQTGQDLGTVLPHSPESVDQLKTINNSVVYYHNKIAPYLDRNLIISNVTKLKLGNKIKQQVLQFVKQHNISTQVIGLHLRKTENPRLDEDKLWRQVQKNSSQQYFVCSDDQSTELKFAKFANVYRWPKTSYVDKLVPGDWQVETVDSNGRRYNYNINRPRQSVIEAFIDMLILSQTTIQFTVKSSFSRFAELFSASDVLHEQD